MKIEQVGLKLQDRAGSQLLTFETVINDKQYQNQVIIIYGHPNDIEFKSDTGDFLRAVAESVINSFEKFKEELKK